MTTTPKPLYEGTLTTTLTATLYTVPASTTAVATSLTITNKSGSTANVTLKVNGTTKFSAEPFAAGQRLVLGPADVNWPILTGNSITGGASAGSAIDVAIGGAEVS